jgi:hypothetical protein
MKTTLAHKIASSCQARHNCIASKNHNWESIHTDKIESYNDLLPSGSGIDSGSTIDIESSNQDQVIITADYHAMNDVGMYSGWFGFKITVTPAFHGINIDIELTYNDTDLYFYNDNCECESDCTCIPIPYTDDDLIELYFDMLSEQYHYILSQPIE